MYYTRTTKEANKKMELKQSNQEMQCNKNSQNNQPDQKKLIISSNIGAYIVINQLYSITCELPYWIKNTNNFNIEVFFVGVILCDGEKSEHVVGNIKDMQKYIYSQTYWRNEYWKTIVDIKIKFNFSKRIIIRESKASSKFVGNKLPECKLRIEVTNLLEPSNKCIGHHKLRFRKKTSGEKFKRTLGKKRRNEEIETEQKINIIEKKQRIGDQNNQNNLSYIVLLDDNDVSEDEPFTNNSLKNTTRSVAPSNSSLMSTMPTTHSTSTTSVTNTPSTTMTLASNTISSISQPQRITTLPKNDLHSVYNFSSTYDGLGIRVDSITPNVIGIENFPNNGSRLLSISGIFNKCAIVIQFGCIKIIDQYIILHNEIKMEIPLPQLVTKNFNPNNKIIVPIMLIHKESNTVLSIQWFTYLPALTNSQ